MNKDLTKRVKCEICGKMLLGQAFVRRHCKIVHKDGLANSHPSQKIISNPRNVVRLKKYCILFIHHM